MVSKARVQNNFSRMDCDPVVYIESMEYYKHVTLELHYELIEDLIA